MREPAFWQQRNSLLSRLLMPFGAVYGEITAARMMREGLAVGVPVICVGNYHTGGAGKTPTTLAMVKLLRELGETPVVLSRGHGGKLRGPVKVEPTRHSASHVGDEPLMMARDVPVVIARDRVGGAALARSTGASVIVMDDGFQNHAIVKDLSLIVIDGNRGLGNGRIFPAGPLRAPLDRQLSRTDALMVIGDGTAATGVAALVHGRGGKVFTARLKPDAQSLQILQGKRVLAFAGIGDPGRFFRTLRNAGMDVAVEKAFGDHHPYTMAEIDALVAQARSQDLTLVTTEKDLVKLRDMPAAADIIGFGVALDVEDKDGLRSLVREAINRAKAGIKR
jgi:tetraacyldisaccharide 4'-kinase